MGDQAPVGPRPSPVPRQVLLVKGRRCCWYWSEDQHGPVKVVGVYPNEHIVPASPGEAMCPGCFYSERAAKEHRERSARYLRRG